MKKTIAFFFAAAVLCSSLLAQTGVRWDLGSPGSAGVVMVNGGAGYPPILAVPNVTLNFCGYPANSTGLSGLTLTPCTNFVTTYTDLTLTTACPSNAQVVLQGAGSSGVPITACQATSDSTGNMGVNLAPSSGGGTNLNYYQYTLTVSGVSYGPYTWTSGGGGGGGGGGSCSSGCVLTAPPGSQTITQLTGTSLNVDGGNGVNVDTGTGVSGVVTFGCGTPPSLGSGITFYGPPSCAPYTIGFPSNGSGGYWQGVYTGTNLALSYEAAVQLGTSDVTGTLPINNGGTGGNTAGSAILGIFPFTQIGSIPCGVAGPAWGILPGFSVTSQFGFLEENGAGSCSWVQAPGTVALGMTGASTFTQGCLIKGNGTSSLSCGSITDNGTTIKSTEIAQFGNTQVLTADATPITATTPGTVVFTWGALTVSTNRSFDCEIIYSQTSAAVAGDGIAVQGATNAPTRLDAWGKIDSTDPTSTTYSGSAGSALNITSTTATSVVTVTPGASGTVYQATLHGTIQVGASASTLNILMFTGNALDSIVPKAGSYCTLTP